MERTDFGRAKGADRDWARLARCGGGDSKAAEERLFLGIVERRIFASCRAGAYVRSRLRLNWQVARTPLKSQRER
jgi:hypothetical protein